MRWVYSLLVADVADAERKDAATVDWTDDIGVLCRVNTTINSGGVAVPDTMLADSDVLYTHYIRSKTPVSRIEILTKDSTYDTMCKVYFPGRCRVYQNLDNIRKHRRKLFADRYVTYGSSALGSRVLHDINKKYSTGKFGRSYYVVVGDHNELSKLQDITQWTDKQRQEIELLLAL